MVKKTRAALITSAIAVAQQVLANEEVRRRLSRAPADLVVWARNRQHPANGRLNRLTPAPRFGHGGLERRVDSLATVVSRALPNENDPGRSELTEAISRLRVALDVAKPLPFVQRAKTHRRIEKELEALESSLVEAVLPRRTEPD